MGRLSHYICICGMQLDISGIFQVAIRSVCVSGESAKSREKIGDPRRRIIDGEAAENLLLIKQIINKRLRNKQLINILVL